VITKDLVPEFEFVNTIIMRDGMRTQQYCAPIGSQNFKS
jgi:hypothetical protein